MDGEVYYNNRKEVFETTPSAEEISHMSDADLIKVKDFSIGNRHGRIMFEGETDLSGVDFDKVVTISRGWTEVYPELGCKPPVGTKLNKPARIELYSVFSKDCDSHFGVYLEEVLRRQGAEFLEYNSQNGFWAFRVKHFTKYGLDDDSNSEDSEDMEVPPKEEFEEKIKKEAEGFGGSPMENLEVLHPDSIEATVGDDVMEPMAIPEGRSGQFKIEEEEDQVMKRKKYEILPEENKEIEMPLFHFGTEKEDIKFQAHECDTIYLNVHPSFQEIKKAESRVLAHPPALAQSFRVAWSPNGTFTALSGISQERGTNMLSLHSVREEKKCNNREDYLKIAYDSMMRIIFNESEEKEMSMPSRRSSKVILQGFALSKEAIPVIWKKMVEELCASVDNEGNSEEINAEIEVWALANLLFGNPCVDLSTYFHSHKFIEYNPPKKLLSPIELLVMRKNLLSNWLRNFSDSPEQRSILDCLRSGSPERASILAYQAEKPKFHLAHLINSLGMAGEKQRKYLIEQIKTWENSKNINTDILEIYKILIGEHPKGNDHWKKILGLNLWYKARPEEKISEIIEELENSMKHLREPSDLCYTLLTIYKSIQQHPLENLLNATHFTEKNQEKRIYWMLYFTLKTLFTSAGSKDRDLTEISSLYKENKEVSKKLSKMMIEELEASGYWHWALFIWLLEPDPTQYLSEIGALIQRHIDQIIKEQTLEDFLISKLKIPHCLIEKAKGIFYLSERNYSQALKCFEEAEEWNAAHEVLCEHIAPSLIFSKEISVSSLTLLKMILTKLSTHKHLIPNWPFKGQILHRFFGLLMEKQSLPSANPLNQMCDIFREIKAIGILIEDCPSCPFLEEISKRLKKMSWKLQKAYYQDVEKIPAISPIPIQCLQGSPSQEQEILEDRLLYLMDSFSCNVMEE